MMVVAVSSCHGDHTCCMDGGPNELSDFCHPFSAFLSLRFPGVFCEGDQAVPLQALATRRWCSS